MGALDFGNQAIAASGSRQDVTVVGQGLPINASVTVAATITRPNDTTAYATGDAITDSASAPTAAGGFAWANTARAAGAGGLIVDAVIVDSAAQATKLTGEVWVFAGAALPGLDNDNAAFTPTDAELAKLVAVIPFSTAFVGDATSGAGGNCAYQVAVGQRFRCDPSTSSLFGMLVARNTYTPVANEQFTVILGIHQD